jgi:3-oxoacyl-[acyl-carrier protein] reductase
MARFEGRGVLVTGASGGIGAACVRAFLSEGARVVANGRNQERLAALGTSTVVADVSVPAEARRVVEEAIATLGNLDVLVNNAGVAFEEPAIETSERTWRTTLATNLDAAFFASQVAGRHMRERRSGAIVNVASIDGIVPEAPLLAYNVSKAALITLTRTMAVELAPFGVRVNAISPGETVTAMTEPDIADETFRAAYLARIPQGRFADPDEIARAIVFLASDDASFVNGANLVADGGQVAGAWYDPRMAPEVER